MTPRFETVTVCRHGEYDTQVFETMEEALDRTRVVMEVYAITYPEAYATAEFVVRVAKEN